MFDLADKRNPFADYSIVYVPYCTVDVHIGNTTTKYALGLTVRHKGYVNGSAALDRLAAEFPDATNVAVTGESAGSVAAPLYAGLVSDRLPRPGSRCWRTDRRLPRRAPVERHHRRLGRRQRAPGLGKERPAKRQPVELSRVLHPKRSARPEDCGHSGRVGGEVHRGSSMVMPVQQR
jgi:Pectinacetylesterase